MPKTIICGSGISGLLSALLYCRNGDGPNVVIVEKNSEPGGLLRRFNYGEWGDFDYGMHNMLETGVAELDALLFDLLPKEEWQILEGANRDLAGIFFNGHLQRHTPYIDLRNLPREDFQVCLAEFLEHLNSHGCDTVVDACTTAYDYAVRRFGETVARRTVIPAVEKIHKKPAAELDYMATIFTPMTRLAFCGEALVRELTLSSALRKRIAWPEQRTLPLDRASGRKAMYPVRYGMYRVVESCVRKIKEAGGQLLTNSDIVAIEQGSKRVKAVTIRSGGQQQRIDDVSRLIWTSSIPLLGRYLDVDFTGLKNDRPQRTIVVNLIVDRLPALMGDLYYFFCYDSLFHTFRLTNYSNYCSGAGRNGGYPISMELLMTDDMAAKSEPTKIAAEEYGRFGFATDSRILFSKAECLDGGFPLPSVNNINGLRIIRDRIRAMSLENVELIGILAEDNLFFQTDVLTHAYRKLG